jgi:hypothetical protein
MGAQHHAPAALSLWENLGTLVQKGGCAEQLTVQPVAPLHTNRPYKCHRAVGSNTRTDSRCTPSGLDGRKYSMLSEGTEKTAKLSELLS